MGKRCKTDVTSRRDSRRTVHNSGIATLRDFPSHLRLSAARSNPFSRYRNPSSNSSSRSMS